MTALATNLEGYNLLIYCYHEDHQSGDPYPWQEWRWALADCGSYPAQITPSSELAGTYRGVIAACQQRGELGPCLSPGHVVGDLGFTVLRNKFDPTLVYSKFSGDYNYLAGFTVEAFHVTVAKPLPDRTAGSGNLVFKGEIPQGAVTLHAVGTSSKKMDAVTIRAETMQPFDDNTVLREIYGTEVSGVSRKWAEKPKPLLIGDWSDANSAYWIEAPVIDTTAIAHPDGGKIFKADMGMVAEDTEGVSNAAPSWTIDPAGGGYFFSEGWAWATTERKYVIDYAPADNREIYYNVGDTDRDTLYLKIDAADDNWGAETGEDDGEGTGYTRIKEPTGANIYGTSPHVANDPAKIVSDIILLLLRDANVGAAVDGGDIDLTSFSDFKTVYSNYLGRAHIKEQVKIFDIIDQICFEYGLKIVHVNGKYKLVLLQWRELASPHADSTEIQQGQIISYNDYSDEQFEGISAVEFQYNIRPDYSDDYLTESKNFGLAENIVSSDRIIVKADFIHLAAFTSTIISRFGVLFYGQLRGMELALDFEQMGLNEGDLVNIPATAEFPGGFNNAQVLRTSKDWVRVTNTIVAITNQAFVTT